LNFQKGKKKSKTRIIDGILSDAFGPLRKDQDGNFIENRLSFD